jgi:hypothetical protein
LSLAFFWVRTEGSDGPWVERDSALGDSCTRAGRQIVATPPEHIDLPSSIR